MHYNLHRGASLTVHLLVGGLDDKTDDWIDDIDDQGNMADMRCKKDEMFK